MIDFPASPANGQQFSAAGKLYQYDGVAWVGVAAVARGYSAGDLVLTASSSPPPGTLRANGAAVSRTVYYDLFRSIGTTYGNGDGSTTFNLPDWRGEFFRAFDDGRGVDAGRLMNSAQGSLVGPHNHPIWWASDPNGNFDAIVGRATTSTKYNGQLPLTGDTNGTGAETRPRNIALLACIAYRTGDASGVSGNSGGGGAWEVIQSGDMTGLAGINIPLPAGGYDAFDIVLDDWGQANATDAQLLLQLSADGQTIITESVYFSELTLTAYNAAAPVTNSFAGAGTARLTPAVLGNSTTNPAVYPISGRIHLDNLTRTGRKCILSEFSMIPGSGTMAGNSVRVDGMTILNQSQFQPVMKLVRLCLASSDLSTAYPNTRGRYSLLGLRSVKTASSATPSGRIVGEIVHLPFSAVPEHTLKCNGAAVSRATFQNLFAKIGTTYGAGDGSTTFNLPDMRGFFIRGWDDGRGVDPGRTIGSAQDPSLIANLGVYRSSTTNGVLVGPPVSAFTGDGTAAYPSGDLVPGYPSVTGPYFGNSTGITAQSGSTGPALYGTRPRNIAMMHCIFYE